MTIASTPRACDSMLELLRQETVSSLAVAKVLNLKHEHVCEYITQLHKHVIAEDTDFKALSVMPCKDETGQYFELNRDAALLVLTGYDTRLRLRILLRLEEFGRLLHAEF